MATRRRVVKINSSKPCGGRKPAFDVTDRALRYRAQHPDCIPGPPMRCMWCGARDVEVGHIDGDETNTNPGNLAWTCRSCNQKVAAAMKKAGAGRRTKQFNGKRRGATDWREYAQALGILDGSAIGDVPKAIALIHATSKAKRSEFQKDIWQVRKDRYGPSGRKDGGAVPF